MSLNRRQLLRYTSLLGAGAVAGCASDEEMNTPTPNNEPSGQQDNPSEQNTRAQQPETENPKEVELSAQNSENESPYASLSVAYATAVSDKVPTDPPTLAEDGMKWLFVRMKVTNTGAEEYRLTGAPFIINTGNESYSIVATREDWELRGRTLRPDETTTGWFVFHIPRAATEATITTRSDTSRDYSVTFTHKPSLKTTIPEH